MAKRKPVVKRLVNGGISLSDAKRCGDLNCTSPYADELARHRDFEKEKMLEELKSSEAKTRAKGKRKKDVVDSGGQLVEPLHVKSQEAWKAFIGERYPLNKTFLDDLREFQSSGSVFSDLPDDRNGFTSNGALPLAKRLGFRAHDGTFWSFNSVELNGNDLDPVFGEGSFNRVVVQAYEKRRDHSVYQLLHVHDEPLAFWGHEALFVSSPGGRGSTSTRHSRN